MQQPHFVENWTVLLTAFKNALDELDTPAKPEDERLDPAHASTWWQWFETPFSELVDAFLQVLKTTPLGQATVDERAALNVIQAMHAKDLGRLQFDPKAWIDSHVLSIIMALRSQGRALVVFKTTMSDLVAAARAGDNRALLNAVRIDATVLCCPTAADRINWAVLVKDTRFIRDLGSALMRPGTLDSSPYARLNGALVLMTVGGVAKWLTQKNAYQLFVKGTGLYRERDSADTERSLWQHIQRFRRKNSTKLAQYLSSPIG